MEKPTVFKKITLLALLILGFGAQAWAATPHQDYAQMSIKDCNGCHQQSEIAPNHGAMWVKDTQQLSGLSSAVLLFGLPRGRRNRPRPACLHIGRGLYAEVASNGFQRDSPDQVV